jgi:hypothetical protein
LTAGRNRNTFFFVITAKRGFPFQESRTYDGRILKNFVSIPELYV